MSKDSGFLADYWERYRRTLFETDVTVDLLAFRDLCLTVRDAGRKLIFAGNGASASISSHCAVDFTKQAGVRAVDFNEANLITAFSNDYGYERWIERALRFYAEQGDVAVLISSSGCSPNVVRAAEAARQMGLKVVTFSGFSDSNSLKQLGDINFWVDSSAYNIIECTHMIWLTCACDLILGKAEYGVS